jgi:hypothetical protein
MQGNNDMITQDISKLGECDLYDLIKILTAVANYGYPYKFRAHNVKVEYNSSFGDVYLTNDDNQILIQDCGKPTVMEVCFECQENNYTGCLPKRDCCAQTCSIFSGVNYG